MNRNGMRGDALSTRGISWLWAFDEQTGQIRNDNRSRLREPRGDGESIEGGLRQGGRGPGNEALSMRRRTETKEGRGGSSIYDCFSN